MSESGHVPLIVDLDGTLVRTDTLHEGMLVLARRHPLALLQVPSWLLRGRAYLKRKVAEAEISDVESLPLNAGLMLFLRQAKVDGRTLVLATGANRCIADAVAARLDLFDDVIATDDVNLTGRAKCAALVARYGQRGFDYVGDSRADTPVFAACRVGHAAGTLRVLPRAVVRAGTAEGIAFATPRATWRDWVRALRVHQWAKNTLVVVPTLLNHRVDLSILMTLVLTFAAFSTVASGTYIVNDLLDLPADRAHARKSRRPFAAGEIPIAHGILASVALTVIGLTIAALQGAPVLACLTSYILLTITYSAWLKGKPIIDAVVLAVLYTLRVFTGGLVTDAFVSPWLLQFLMFLFLSLAFLKRYSELYAMRGNAVKNSPGRGYRDGDIDIIGQAGIGTGLVAGQVLALYMNGQEVQRLYARPHMLLAIVPVYIYWIVRVWLIAHRGNMHDDPVVYAFSDKVSYIVGALIVVAVILGMIPVAH